jgi:transposase
MGKVSTIGLDIAKSIFQVHRIDVAVAVVIRKRVSRAKVLEYFGELPSCMVAVKRFRPRIHRGRELQALDRRATCKAATRDPNQINQGVETGHRE